MGIQLIKVKKNSYFFSGSLSIGVYFIENQAILIDSGLDERTAMQVDEVLQAANYQVAAIINTHSHADHCGGNAYFQQKYPTLKIFATRYEKHFIEEPINEPRCFCKGAEPLRELHHPYLEAPPSNVTHTIHPYQDQTLVISGKTFSIITLPGHTPGMIAVVSPDNVLYTGDAIFGDKMLNKSSLLFYTNIADTLASFNKLATLTFDAVVFYHGGLMQADLSSVIKQHQTLVLQAKADILSLVQANTLSLSDLTQRIMLKYKIPANPIQFTLTEVCAQAYIANLQRENKINLTMVDSKLMITCRHSIKPMLPTNAAGAMLSAPIGLPAFVNPFIKNWRLKPWPNCSLYQPVKLTLSPLLYKPLPHTIKKPTMLGKKSALRSVFLFSGYALACAKKPRVFPLFRK